MLKRQLALLTGTKLLYFPLSLSNETSLTCLPVCLPSSPELPPLTNKIPFNEAPTVFANGGISCEFQNNCNHNSNCSLTPTLADGGCGLWVWKAQSILFNLRVIFYTELRTFYVFPLEKTNIMNIKILGLLSRTLKYVVSLSTKYTM